MEYSIDDIKLELESNDNAILEIRFTKKKYGFIPTKTIQGIQIGCIIPGRAPIEFQMVKAYLHYKKPNANGDRRSPALRARNELKPALARAPSCIPRNSTTSTKEARQKQRLAWRVVLLRPYSPLT
ncbi:hypothetical protein TNCV_1921731 [Trichonephila clavipes]|nr:hypothetical protein TNCV_1921731 [Trichonephila clavipes]